METGKMINDFFAFFRQHGNLYINNDGAMKLFKCGFANHVVDQINIMLFNQPYALIRLLSILNLDYDSVIWQN